MSSKYNFDQLSETNSSTNCRGPHIWRAIHWSKELLQRGLC